MAALTPVLPATVVDQIGHWAAERDRLTYEPARLYENFLSFDVFSKTEQYARDIGSRLATSAAVYTAGGATAAAAAAATS